MTAINAAVTAKGSRQIRSAGSPFESSSSLAALFALILLAPRCTWTDDDPSQDPLAGLSHENFRVKESECL